MRKIARPTLGVKPPLFDRIKESSDGGYRRLLSMDELKESIQNEIAIMMQSRVAIKKAQYDGDIGTIAVYGAPEFSGLVDFSYFNAQSEDDWPDIANYLKTAIELVEPRVKNVRVKILEFDKYTQELIVNLNAQLTIGDNDQEISFPLVLPSANR